MDGDSFSDPRRRSTRGRGRGSRGGGRGALRGARGSSKGRGGRGGGTKRPGLPRRKADELGSNDYRFREPEENEDEDEFEVGVDIEEAAASSMADDPHAEAYGLNEDVFSGMFSVDLDVMEKALQSVPLWVRLGNISRFALGVADEDVVENYLGPFEDEEESNVEQFAGKGVVDEFAEALADLNFDDVNEDHAGTPDQAVSTAEPKLESIGMDDKRILVSNVASTSADNQSASAGMVKNKKSVDTAVAISADVRDDFDEWLDDV